MTNALPTTGDRVVRTSKLVRALLTARALENLLSQLARNGAIGNVQPAGAARIAMVGAALGLEEGDRDAG